MLATVEDNLMLNQGENDVFILLIQEPNDIGCCHAMVHKQIADC
jgi:hypothetical protein